MSGVCMASAVDAALVDMQDTVFERYYMTCIEQGRGSIHYRTNRPSSIRRKTSRWRNVDSMFQRTMPHMGCNSSGYSRDFTHCVNFLSTRSCSRKRCNAQETKLRGSVTNTWIRSSNNWNKRCIQFWRVRVRQEYWESNIQWFIRWKRDRLPVPAYIRRDPEREQLSHFLDPLNNVTISESVFQWEASKSNNLCSTFKH